MNFTKVYGDIINAVEPEKPDPKVELSAAVLAQQHMEWMNHPTTKRFISALALESKKLVASAANNSFHPDTADAVVRFEMIKQKQTDKILEYVILNIARTASI